jgi:hypothetical protein
VISHISRKTSERIRIFRPAPRFLFVVGRATDIQFRSYRIFINGFGVTKAGWFAGASSLFSNAFLRGRAETLAAKETGMLIVLIILLLVFGFGGYRLGPGLGYYGGGGVSLIILIVIILLLLRVI